MRAFITPGVLGAVLVQVSEDYRKTMKQDKQDKH